jgi:hypothetical protein
MPSLFLDLFLSEDPSFDTGDEFLGRSRIKSIAVGGATEIGLGARLAAPLSASGRYVIALLDSTGVFSECLGTNHIVVRGPIGPASVPPRR